MRQITITCAGNSAVADSYNAGYQGEHNATQLSWELSEDLQNYNYILAFALPDGNTESIIIDKYPIVYSLSQTITQLAGTVTVQLTVLDDDGELIYKTQQVQLRIANSVNIDNTAKPYVSELTQAIEQFIATKSLDNIALTAERNSEGVTISITDKDKTVSTYSIFDGSDYVLTDNDKQDIATVVTDDLSDKLASKQDKLIAGENIKTVNNQSILGEGDITIGEKNLTMKTVTLTEEVNEIFFETPDFDVCFVNVKTNSATCKYKIIYHNANAPSLYNDYTAPTTSTAQYGNYHKIEKQPSTLNYKYNGFRLTPTGNMMIAYYTNYPDNKNGIILKSVNDTSFPAGTIAEIYYR